MNIAFASLLAFLPERYRRACLQGHEVPSNAALLSGALELVVALNFLIRGYFVFANHWLGNVPFGVVSGAMAHSGESGVMSLGVFVWLGYVLQPLTIVLAYFSVEGAARALAAVFSGEVTGSLPFWLIAFGQSKVNEWHEERMLGPRIADEVTNVEDGLRVASCRPKSDWNQRVTISYQQVLYELAGEEEGAKPRPFVYVLRKKPEYKVIRGLRYYSPEEGLR